MWHGWRTRLGRRASCITGGSPQPPQPVQSRVPTLKAPWVQAAGTSACLKDKRYAASLQKVGSIPLEESFGDRGGLWLIPRVLLIHISFQKEEITREMRYRTKIGKRSPSGPGGGRAAGWGEPSIPGYCSHLAGLRSPAKPNHEARVAGRRKEGISRAGRGPGFEGRQRGLADNREG